jgi:hypothetical protein
MHTCIYSVSASQRSAYFVRHILNTDNEWVSDDMYMEYLDILNRPKYAGHSLQCRVIKWGEVPAHFNMSGLSIEGTCEKPADMPLKYDYYLDSAEDLEDYERFAREYVDAEKERKPLMTFRTKRMGVGATGQESGVMSAEWWSANSPWWKTQEEAVAAEAPHATALMGESIDSVAPATTSTLGFASFRSEQAAPTKLKPMRTILVFSNGRSVEDTVDEYWLRNLGTPMFPDAKPSEVIQVFPSFIQYRSGEKTESFILSRQLIELFNSFLTTVLELKAEFSMNSLVEFVRSIKPTKAMVAAEIAATTAATTTTAIGTPTTPNPNFVFTVGEESAEEPCSASAVFNALKTAHINSIEEIDDLHFIYVGSSGFRRMHEGCFDRTKRPTLLNAIYSTIHSVIGGRQWDTRFERLKTIKYADRTNAAHVKLFLLLDCLANKISLGDYEKEYKDFIYSTVVAIFIAHNTVREAGSRVGAQQLWEAFGIFLKENALIFPDVGSLGSQQMFKTAVESTGIQQKRLANGKVWMNVKMVGNESPIFSLKAVEQAASLLKVPVPAAAIEASQACQEHNGPTMEVLEAE